MYQGKNTTSSIETYISRVFKKKSNVASPFAWISITKISTRLYVRLRCSLTTKSLMKRRCLSGWRRGVTQDLTTNPRMKLMRVFTQSITGRSASSLFSWVKQTIQLLSISLQVIAQEWKRPSCSWAAQLSFKWDLSCSIWRNLRAYAVKSSSRLHVRSDWTN